MTPSRRCVPQLGHKLEEAIDEVMNFLREVFDDFVRYSVGSGCFTYGGAGKGCRVVSFGECLIHGREGLSDGGGL